MNNLLLVIIVFGVLLISGAPVVLAMAFPAIIYFIIEGIPLFKHVVPLYIPLMLSLLLVTFVPQISLWLPQLLFG